MNQIEIVKFSLGGFNLQEPMAFISNMLIASFSLFAYFSTKWASTKSSKYFSYFYLCMGISTFFGGLGHLLFQYFGVIGKFPSWVGAVLCGVFIGKGVLEYWKVKKSYQLFHVFLLVKSISLLLLSLFFGTFLFIAIDAILTYIIYCGILPGNMWYNNKLEMKYFVYGIIILFPSAFIFLLNINIHKFFNKDDFSHILMLSGIIFFFVGIKKLNKINLKLNS
jgi:hypothetical protein